jgi:hypothetical protein
MRPTPGRSVVLSTQIHPGRKIRLTMSGLLIRDRSMAAKILDLIQRDCCMTLVVVACCPEEDAGKVETTQDYKIGDVLMGCGGDILMGCGDDEEND